MGNSQNLPEDQTSIAEKAIEHRHLGRIETKSHSIHGLCFLKVYHFGDQMMSHEKLRRFQARMKKYNSIESVVSLWAVQLKEKQQMCAHNSELHLYFQRYNQSLRNALEAKLKDKKNFTELQILEFLQLTVKTLIFLQDNGFKNSQLDKDSILLCGNKIKILDMAISVTSPYQAFLDEGKYQDGCYFSPELLKDLKQRNFQPFVSPKSDVFSLGMLTLQMACLEPLDNYYDMDSFSIDYDSLIHRVSRIVYTTQLKTLIAGMLEYEGDLRLGLISLQQKIQKMLKVNNDQNDDNKSKRSRSSSTKMLKELLTTSRRSVFTSQKSSNSQTLIRKNSSTSLNSMASGALNPRSSLNSQLGKKKQIKREREETIPTPDQTNMLRNMVKNKTSTQHHKEQPKIGQNFSSVNIPMINQSNTSSVNQYVFNKENYSYGTSNPSYSYGMPNNSYGTSNPHNSYIDNVMALHDIRRSAYNSKTFFDVPCYPMKEKTSITPRMVDQPFFRKEKKQEESIFKLIENDPRYNSGISERLSAHQNSIKNNNPFSKSKQKNNMYEISANIPTFSPLGFPKIQRVQQTSSIPRPEPIDRDEKEVAQFFGEKDQNEEGDDKFHIHVCPPIISKQSIKIESISFRVKNSLDNMYKTTRSITSSGEKSNPPSGHKDLYKKIELPNGCYYEGEVINGDTFQGNGILYAPDHQVIYNGSWSEGRYDGFGTLYNLKVMQQSADKFDLASSSMNWMKYEGEFKRGDRQGFGTIYFANGERFSGCMKNGEVNGYGCFYDTRNEMTSGIWTCNRLQV